MTTTVNHPISTDLGQRGIAPSVLAAFAVENGPDGWFYTVKTRSGAPGRRWKSYSSTRPKGAGDKWRKYAWVPSKPEGADYCYPVGWSLSEAIRADNGRLYLTGGDPASWAMHSAGIRNTTNFFGDTVIPASFVQDLEAWDVKEVVIIPDRDKSGEAWARRVIEVVNIAGIFYRTLALPFPLLDSHGKDPNDLWLSAGCDREAFLKALAEAPLWPLPAIQPVVQPRAARLDDEAEVEIPASFLNAIEQKLVITHGYRENGWSKRPVRCPFHNDTHPSAFWHAEKAILRCFSGCGQTFLAKEVGKALGIELRDFLPPRSVMPPRPSKASAAAPEPPARALAVAQPPERGPSLRPALSADCAASRWPELAAGGRNWLDAYIAWAKAASPLTPYSFHEAMGLWVLAAMTARRAQLIIGTERIYPNLYIMIIGRSTVFRKSTAMNLARRLLDKAGLESRLLPEEATAEALFDELAGSRPKNFDDLPVETRERWLASRSFAAQRALMIDEVSALFANLKKEYMQGLSELVLRGYDGDGPRYTKALKGKGLVSISGLCLSVLGATTPVMVAKHVGVEEYENGLAARFALVTPDEQPVYQEPDEAAAEPPGLLVKALTAANERLPRPSRIADDAEPLPPPVTALRISAEAAKLLTSYRRAVGYDFPVSGLLNDHQGAAYARLGTMAVKCATLLAIADPAGQVEERHAAAGIGIAEGWRESLHRLEVELADRTDECARILSFLTPLQAAGATGREIARATGIREKTALVAALQSLIDAGQVETLRRQPASPVERPSVIYRLPVPISAPA